MYLRIQKLKTLDKNDSTEKAVSEAQSLIVDYSQQFCNLRPLLRFKLALVQTMLVNYQKPIEANNNFDVNNNDNDSSCVI